MAYINVINPHTYEKCCVRSRYQWQGQVITSHGICGIYLLTPALDTFFWHNTPHTNCQRAVYPIEYRQYCALPCFVMVIWSFLCGIKLQIYPYSSWLWYLIIPAPVTHPWRIWMKMIRTKRWQRANRVHKSWDVHRKCLPWTPFTNMV